MMSGRGSESDGLQWSAEVAVGPYGALIFSQDDEGSRPPAVTQALGAAAGYEAAFLRRFAGPASWRSMARNP